MQGWLTFSLAGQISKQNSLKKGLIIMFFLRMSNFRTYCSARNLKSLDLHITYLSREDLGHAAWRLVFALLFLIFHPYHFCVCMYVCMCVCVWMKARICWSKYSFIFFQRFFWKNKKNWFRPNEKEKTFRRLIVKEQVLSQTTNQWKHFWKSLWPLPNPKLF